MRFITVMTPVTTGIFCTQFIKHFLRLYNMTVTTPEPGAVKTYDGAVRGCLPGRTDVNS